MIAVCRCIADIAEFVAVADSICMIYLPNLYAAVAAVFEFICMLYLYL